jgi:N6-L-threonylcarbamoyladenine synthase
MTIVMGIETSCDETGVGFVEDGVLLGDALASSMDEHARFGGVVPEIAARAHVQSMLPTVRKAVANAAITLGDVGAVAVTAGPGLATALHVGVAAAKAFALSLDVPLYGVHHLAGHAAADTLEHGPLPDRSVALIVSGGHTSLLFVRDLVRTPIVHLSDTLDDAAGEAFDKGARLLGLGYPGGPALERLAREGDAGAFRFPTGARVRGLDFSFAGLKTALLYKVRELGEAESTRRRADLAASYQHAIVEALCVRVERALDQTGLDRLAIGGGVAANGPLRERLAGIGVQVEIPDRLLCTDNAAMIASAARYVEPLPFPEYLRLDVYATGELPDAVAA